MSSTIDETALEERLAALEAARTWSPRVISRLEARIRDGEDRDVFRINPLAYAASTGIDEAEAVDLFLHAASVGLVDMEWNIVCTSCGNTARSFRALAKLDPHLDCELCQARTDTSLDDYIQVAFTVAPAVRRLAYHDPAGLSVRDLIFVMQLSHDVKPTLAGRTYPEVLEEATRFAGYLDPGGEVSFEVDLTGDGFVVRDALTGANALYMVRPDAGTADEPTSIELALEDAGFVDGAHDLQPFTYRFEDRPDPVFPFDGAAAVPPGPAQVRVMNTTAARAAIWAHEYPQVPSTFRPIEFEPVLTARRVLSTQTFRTLFRSQTLAASEGLAVADMTFLFTDLQDSTRMYDEIGDATAYNLVRLHFDALESVIADHGGAIVKTIGDAIMATFIDAAAGVRAALAMSDRLAEFNRTASAQLALKIGIHRGHAIAVTSNEQMDYFGQTVNIAARIQGQARAGELCLSEDVFGASGVRSALGDRPVTREAGQMKGVAGELGFYRVALAG